VFHGFFTEVETYSAARRAVADACQRLREAFDS
jgi:acetyl esterase